MRIIVRNSDNIITQYSANGLPEPDENSTAVDLNEQQSIELIDIIAAPNGGIKFENNGFIALPVPPPPIPPPPIE